MPGLHDRVILVTGAGGGIGRGIALAVADAGGRVVATDLDASAAEETAAAARARGSTSHAFALDVTDDAAMTRAVTASVDAFGQLDGLVANAGILRMAPATDATPKDWHRQLEVNARAVLSGCQAVARWLIGAGRGGAIVNVASNAGKVGYPEMVGYNAAKAAVISMTRTLAAEWAAHGINVNAVCPGGVATPMLTEVARFVAHRDGGDPEALYEQMTPHQLGRHVRPIEVGRVVAFLLSDDATIIRGQAINVDGGDTPY